MNIDPNTVLTTLATAYGGKKIIEKFCGPTAEYVGEGIRDWTKNRVENIQKIFEAGFKKLGEGIDTPGTVPPRVIKEILFEGSFTDDPLAVEYYGGVLASSRGPISRDDRGAALLKLVGTMSTYQLRAHHIFYTILKRLFDGAGDKRDYLLNPGLQEHRHAMRSYITLDAFAEAMEFTSKEDNSSLLPHLAFGLKDLSLLENFQFGGDEAMHELFGNKLGAGIVFEPSARGAELFLWANGQGKVPIERFLDPAVEAVPLPGITIPNYYIKVLP